MEAASLTAPAGLVAARGGRLLRLRSDDQLVALFRVGNDDAFRVIHDRYRARLLAYTRHMLAGSSADAEDALQDVFLRAYGTLRADGRPVTLRAWLYRVAHNRCIDQMRRPANRPSVELQDGAVAGPGGDPWADLQHRDDLRQLVADVRRLPDQQRSALLMREMEGLAYAELADALGVSLPAVKSLLVRARIGLVEAREARDTACVEIRADLAAAHDRGVKANARSRRHVRECDACGDYRAALRRVREGVAALGPAPTGWGVVTKLLGLGGGGAAVTASGGGGGAAATGIVAAGGSAKVAALVGAAAVVGGGAVGATHELARLAARDAAAAGPRAPSVIARAAPAAALAAALVDRRVAGPMPPRASLRITVRALPAPGSRDDPGARAVSATPAATASWTIAEDDAALGGSGAKDFRTAVASGGALAPADAADPDPLQAASDSGAAGAGAPTTTDSSQPPVDPGSVVGDPGAQAGADGSGPPAGGPAPPAATVSFGIKATAAAGGSATSGAGRQ